MTQCARTFDEKSMLLKRHGKTAVRALRALCSARALVFARKNKRLRVARVGARFSYGKVGAAPLCGGARLPNLEELTMSEKPILQLSQREAGSVFDAGLMCSLLRLEYDPRSKAGALWLDDGNCTDMSGAIAVFECIDPAVKAIFTYSAGRRDTAYHRTEGGEWRAVTAPAGKAFSHAQP